MMRRTFVGAAVVAILLLLPSRPASAQGLSSLAAAMTNSLTTVEKKAGCWICDAVGFSPACKGGSIPGYYNCSVTPFSCAYSSSGCGGPIGLQLDPDGGTQFVSRASHMGIPVSVLASDPTVRRNCDGVVVARSQSAADIMDIRTRTGALSL